MRVISRYLKNRNLMIASVVFMLFLLLRTETELPDETDKDSEAVNKSRLPQARLKDWHNYTQIKRENRRTGLGEQGQPAFLPKSEEELGKKLSSEYRFNAALSDKIALNRSLPDIRYRRCKNRMYLETLPTVSVIVPFHDEHWSTLLRTAYSVLNRSPRQLIKEIFLVDDASTKDFLKDKLDKYLAEHLPKVKVVRLRKLKGLVKARLAGAKLATADVLVFLDSHSEVNVNWLPPLIEPIAKNYKTAVCPIVDEIARDTFEYRPEEELARGAFNWELVYKRLDLLPKNIEKFPDPYESPVMAVALFAISRKFFWELRGYDSGLQLWGGEHFELSFKIWQCGGRLLNAPCSRVGHIKRDFVPRGVIGKNHRRIAEVWMDEYAQYLYNRRPHYKDIDPGDLTRQKAIRAKLKCKSFMWFMNKVAFDVTRRFPLVEPLPYAQGRIRPSGNDTLCVDARHGRRDDYLHISQCSGDPEQTFQLTYLKDVKVSTRNMCWDVPSPQKTAVLLYPCHHAGGNQEWRYDQDRQQLRHSSDKCLDYSQNQSNLFVSECSDKLERQRWVIDEVDMDRLEQWEQKLAALPHVDDGSY